MPPKLAPNFPAVDDFHPQLDEFTFRAGTNEREKKNDQYSSSAVKVRKIGASFYEGHITITLTRKRTELDIYYTSSRRITFFLCVARII